MGSSSLIESKRMGYRSSTTNYYDRAAELAKALVEAGHAESGRKVADALLVSLSPLEIAYVLREALATLSRDHRIAVHHRDEAAAVWQLVDQAIDGQPPGGDRR